MTGPLLRLRDVTVRFGGLPAVDGASLDVAPGRIVALVGPNGAGKTTLLRVVAGLHHPTSGRVLLDGGDVTRLAPHALRRRGVATVLQTPRPLAGLTSRQDVALGAMFGTPGGRRSRSASLAAADDALRLVGLGAQADRDVDRLNLHERRLVDLARALAGRPRLLLLDEVMAGLEPAEVAHAVQVVRAVRDDTGVAVVWVEHVLQAVRSLADEVAVLHLGRLLAHDAPDVALRDPAVVEAYLGRGVA